MKPASAKPASAIKPTQEQQLILDSDAHIIKVGATAGSGKTSTIKMFSAVNKVPSIYLAFNKSIADEVGSGMGTHVKARTTHSLAFSKFGKAIAKKLNRPKGRYVNVAGTPREIGTYYKLPTISLSEGTDDAKNKITPTQLGLLVKDAVKRFQASADSVIGKKHMPSLPYPTYETKVRVEGLVLRTAQKHWDNKKNPSSNVLADHDTYLKMFQLSEPKLSFDIVYLDEAQDTTDCVLDIVMRQKDHARIVLVGDDYQAIYGWRGAVNAMSKVNGDDVERFLLSKSFRYGQPIADVAKTIISGAIDVKGHDPIDSEVGQDVVNTRKEYAMIFRTNSELLSTAVHLTMEGKRVRAEIDSRDFIKLLESAQALFDGKLKDVKHDTVIPYSDWGEFLEAGEADAEIKRVTNVVKQGKTMLYISTLSKLAKRGGDADVILTTGHKSKGREFDQVVLADDFPDIDSNRFDNQEEINLLYVAATRAIHRLNINKAVKDRQAAHQTPITTEVCAMNRLNHKAVTKAIINKMDEKFEEKHGSVHVDDEGILNFHECAM